MSTMRVNVLLWAQRVVAMKTSPPHVLLGIGDGASPTEIQDAFHKIARTSHPDLFRNGLDAQELELVTSAYAIVAGAYQQMRTTAMQTQRMKPLSLEEPLAIDEPTPPPTTIPTQQIPRTATSQIPRTTTSQIPRTQPLPRAPVQTPSGGARTVQPPPAEVPASPSGAAPAANAAQSMSPKALLYYRKAELCLKRGDLRGAILQLKLACATDPTSGFLRTALAEVEAEVRAKT
jgi:hypothetical protein